MFTQHHAVVNQVGLKSILIIGQKLSKIGTYNERQILTSVNQSLTDQSSTRILDPKNSRENQLDFVSLNHQTQFSISRSCLETREGNKEFPVFVMKNEIPFKFPNGRSCIYLRNVKKIDSPLLWKISLQLQATNQILARILSTLISFSSEIEDNESILVQTENFSRSRLEV